MKIGQCENCKGFQPIPETWSRLILCRECNAQNGKSGIFGVNVIAIPMPTTLAKPVKIDLKNFNPAKARRNRPKGMA